MKPMNPKTRYDVYNIPYAIMETRNEIEEAKKNLVILEDRLKKLLKKEEQFNKRILRK